MRAAVERSQALVAFVEDSRLVDVSDGIRALVGDDEAGRARAALIALVASAGLATEGQRARVEGPIVEDAR